MTFQDSVRVPRNEWEAKYPRVAHAVFDSNWCLVDCAGDADIRSRLKSRMPNLATFVGFDYIVAELRAQMQPTVIGWRSRNSLTMDSPFSGDTLGDIVELRAVVVRRTAPFGRGSEWSKPGTSVTL